MNLYKTTICRYFELQEICPMAENCHYAHGEHELRKSTDPVPEQIKKSRKKKKAAPQNIETESNSSTNFKTVVCKYWLSGKCKYETGCNFAHGERDLRTLVSLKLK